ncbi:MAG: pilus assembly protein PilZ [Treponema sp. GWB1_62_6]|nr:MAG: pilus assembly protein PilZ [Treponema sp. GWA1_62_8]OHE64921.1 MAG: pilus assembly protein PilZ [Treponema sp. GWB1_62_6]OHE66997.1 MAG: pilus assembly protein PilZ [Treponema sp. GWC1_61_84]OHE70909.1 MAG: pilus assembly protein PilZ [Treponema sp. RIFOXYC1_FULL_61_9]
MKALLVVGSDAAFRLLAFYLKPLGFELIRYRQPTKAMDNIDEVDPDAIIISAEDFPRHWKTLAQFVRCERTKDRTALVILKGNTFPYEEAAKAAHIGINGIVSENLDNREELDRLLAVLARYAPVDEGRIARRLRPADWDKLEFLFSRPDTGAIVTGKVEDISATGISFLPDRPVLLEGLESGLELSDCSLRAGDSILAPTCRVVRNARIVALAFTAFSDEERAVFNAYLAERPLRERKRIR